MACKFTAAEFAMRVHDGRIMRGMTQEALGEMVGLCEQRISDVETGVMLPRIDVVMRIADALHVDLEWLACEQDMVRRADSMEW